MVLILKFGYDSLIQLTSQVFQTKDDKYTYYKFLDDMSNLMNIWNNFSVPKRLVVSHVRVKSCGINEECLKCSINSSRVTVFQMPPKTTFDTFMLTKLTYIIL